MFEGILINIAIPYFRVLYFSFIPFHNSKEFDNYGKEELIQYLNNIEDEQRKKEEIDNAIEKGLITENDLK